MKLLTDAMLTIAPPPAAFMWGIVCLTVFAAPTTLTPRTRCQSSPVTSSIVPKTKTAASLTSTSTVPNASTAPATISSTSDSTDTSVLMKVASPLASRISRMVSSPPL